MGPRVLLASGLSVVATLAVVVLGRVPLIVGLMGTAVAGYAMLPGESRRYLGRRITRVVASVLLSMAIVWMLVYHLPSSPSDGFEPINAMQAYGSWLADLPSGNLGHTQYSESVTEGISRTIPISMQLVLYGQLIAGAIAVPGALLGARLRGSKADVVVRGVSLFGLSMPIYVTGPLLVLFLSIGGLTIADLDIGVRILPAVRYVPIGESVIDHLRSMALPSLTLGLSTAAVYLVLLRSELVQQLSQAHVELARAKGISDRRIVRVHALRPAAPSVVAAAAAHSALLLGHVIIIERIFLMPGFGDYFIVAIARNDIPAIIGALFVATVILGVINVFADALLLVLDPRIGE